VVATADGHEAVQTDITVVRGGSGAAQTFTLRSDSALRIGRGVANDIVLDFNGVSAYHAELSLQQDAVNGAASHTICIRDDSKNGTGVRPGPHAPEVVLKNGALPAWESLVKGVNRALEHGWQLIVPMRSRKGESQMPEIMRMITVYHGSKVGPTTGVDELDGDIWEPAAELDEAVPASTKKGDVGEALILRKGQFKENEAPAGQQDGPVIKAVGALPGVTTPWPRPQSAHYAQAIAPLSAGGQVFAAVAKEAEADQRASPPIEKVKKKKKEKRAKEREVEVDDEEVEAEDSDEEEGKKQKKDKKKKKKRKDRKREEEDDEDDHKRRAREERERLEREFEDEIALEEKRKQRLLKQKEQEEADRDREDVLAMEKEEREFEERRQKQRQERERRLAELRKAREEEEARAAAEAAREAEAARKPATPAVVAAPSRRSMDGESGDEYAAAWGQALKEALKPMTPAGASAGPTPRVAAKEGLGDVTPALHAGDTTPAVHRQGPQTPAGEKADTAPKSPQPPTVRPAAGTPAAGTPGAAPGSATGLKASAGTPTVAHLLPEDTQVEDAQLPSSDSLGLVADTAAEAPEAAKPSEAAEPEEEEDEKIVPTEAGEPEEDEATPAEIAQPEAEEAAEDEEAEEDNGSDADGAGAETDREAVEAEEAAAAAPADEIPPDDAPPALAAPSPQAARTKTKAEIAFEVCECGATFVQDSLFCRKCGRKRPPKPEIEAVVQAVAPPKPATPKGDADSMPAPPVASRLTAHAIATAVGAPPGVDKDLEPDLRSVSPISTPGIFVAKRKRRRADSLASEDSAPRASKKKTRGRTHRKAPSPSRWRPVSPSRFKTVSPSRQRQATVSPSRGSLQPSVPRQSFRFRPVSVAARGRAIVRNNEEDTRPKAKRRRAVSPSREARWQPSTTVARRSPTAGTRSPTARGVSPISGEDEPEPVKPAKVKAKKEKRGEKAHKAKAKKEKRGDQGATGKRKDKPKKQKRGLADD